MSEFTILKTYPINRSGTSSEYLQMVRCPNCKFEFARHVKEGCFNSDIDPDFCPNCNYPLIRKEKHEFNPSKR
jgi:ssDNA-binding Zn-finger/Zn-ribbon topoisomerase 1